MEVQLTQDQLDGLNRRASTTGRGSGELVHEAVDNLLAYNRWFSEQVQVGLDQIRRGELVEDEEVHARISEQAVHIVRILHGAQDWARLKLRP
jgi:predicted transcriptional regulator